MGIGEPARNDGVAEDDMQHAVRNAVRRRDLGENLTMLIGPASDGTLRVMGVPDLDGDDPVVIHAMGLCLPTSIDSSDEEVTAMRHTDIEIEQAARCFEQLADDLDPATAEIDDTEDLRAVAVASAAARADEARLREAVEVARAHGRSWNHIALALGVSRQAARQRFVQPESRGIS